MSGPLPLSTRVAAFIERERLFNPTDLLIVGVSGGLDSVVLTHLLLELGYRPRLAHYDYGLRGEESTQDRLFVQALATRLGLSFDWRSSNATESQRLREGNLQAEARKLRYAWFTELQVDHPGSRVCVAHHLNDNLETILLQLSRGTNFGGLTGMAPRLENGLCRPLLETPRAELEDYARHRSLAWREDRTNATDDYLRNYVRHHLTPELLRLQTDGPVRLAGTLRRLRTEHELFTAGLSALWERATVAPRTVDRRRLPTDPDLAIRLLQLKLQHHGFKGDQFRQMLEAGSGTRLVGRTATLEIRKFLLMIFPHEPL